MSNKIELKSISELFGMNFFIPDYQRGYRWTEQQVKDLLDDILEFIEKNQSGFYCIQPLVVRERKQETFKLIKNEAKDLDEIKNLLKGSWEVIDGQQRLTTIYIFLSYLESSSKYTIEYETRPDSKSFLTNIEEKKNEENIDYYHIVKAKNQIDVWFNGKNYEEKRKFSNALLDKVKFIWYESVDEDPIKVFTRLNIGKIPLTNAELVKALFLNKSNFKDADYKKIRLQQQEIASEWNTIENTLQNDEFWLFLNELKYDKPTRIDFIFDLICEKNSLGLTKEEMKDIGTDEYKTFRYFYCWFKKQHDITECWQKIKLFYQTFQEWFNDLELYHYVGYLIECGIAIFDIYDNWIDTKNDFKVYIKKRIQDQVSLKGKLLHSDDKTQYDKILNFENNSDKSLMRRIFLLHNIQSVINQNQTLKENNKYKLSVFYKFPFHLYKKERQNGGWDVEHIDSYTDNPMEKENERKEWLRYSSIGIELINDLKDNIIRYIAAKKDDKRPDFNELYSEIVKSYRQTGEDKNKLSDEEKNYIWNLTLLDSSTNRGYGNSIFPAKRRVIIGKDQGKAIYINDNLEIKEENGTIAFIPPTTKNIFLKYYNPATNNLREWDRKDAEAYLDNIKTVLKDFSK